MPSFSGAYESLNANALGVATWSLLVWNLSVLFGTWYYDVRAGDAGGASPDALVSLYKFFARDTSRLTKETPVQNFVVGITQTLLYFVVAATLVMAARRAVSAARSTRSGAPRIVAWVGFGLLVLSAANVVFAAFGSIALSTRNGGTAGLAPDLPCWLAHAVDRDALSNPGWEGPGAKSTRKTAVLMGFQSAIWTISAVGIASLLITAKRNN